MSALSSTPPSPIYGHPEIILQDLIRFDTTDPPRNEADCIGYIRRALSDAGLETSLPARDARQRVKCPFDFFMK